MKKPLQKPLQKPLHFRSENQPKALNFHRFFQILGGPKKEQPGLTLEREARLIGGTILR